MASDDKLRRKKALDMDEVVKMFIDSMKISAGLNTQRVFEAWDKASHAGKYTLNKFYRDGTLYVNISSSMVRNQLYFQQADIISEMNRILKEDNLFTKNDPRVGYVSKIVLK